MTTAARRSHQRRTRESSGGLNKLLDEARLTLPPSLSLSLPACTARVRPPQGTNSTRPNKRLHPTRTQQLARGAPDLWPRATARHRPSKEKRARNASPAIRRRRGSPGPGGGGAGRWLENLSELPMTCARGGCCLALHGQRRPNSHVTCAPPSSSPLLCRVGRVPSV